MMAYSFILASPHFIYGSGDRAMSFVKHENTSSLLTADGITTESQQFCNATTVQDTEPPVESYMWVLVIFFAGHFMCGIANSIFWSLLITYMDNNVSKTKAPLVHSK